jgi:hypothetical protein
MHSRGRPTGHLVCTTYKNYDMPIQSFDKIEEEKLCASCVIYLYTEGLADLHESGQKLKTLRDSNVKRPGVDVYVWKKKESRYKISPVVAGDRSIDGYVDESKGRVGSEDDGIEIRMGM